MEELIEKLGWKKIALIAIAASLLGFAILIGTFQNNGTAKPEQNGNNSQPDSGSSGSSNDSTKGSFSVPSSKNFRNTYYSLEYPTYYSVQTFPQEGTVNYCEFSDPTRNLKIKITVYDPAHDPLTTLEKPFLLLGFDPENYKINNRNVDEFLKIKNDTQISFQKVNFVQKDGKIIKLDFTYSGSESQFEAERDFIRMLSSLN